jgi:hypothetical protein
MWLARRHRSRRNELNTAEINMNRKAKSKKGKGAGSHAVTNKARHNKDAVMDPWPNTEADTRDIVALGYTYV